MNPEDIFIVAHSAWSVTVVLAWDMTKYETVGADDHIGSDTAAEALAIGMLWQKYGVEIINYIQTSGRYR